MDGTAAIVLIVIGTIISCFILYMVIKAAVKDGIIEARRTAEKGGAKEEQDTIAKTTCSFCGEEYDMDYPKCPFCGDH